MNTSLIIRKCKFKCDNFTGVVGQQRIPKIFLEDFLFPIPPISEQRRIAKQIQHYFNLLDIINQNQVELQQLSE
ncbi:restriction endonuclease subunit S [Streptococcus orisratti]|uniref:restriction endonuclease subunit S n=1 Tax=Streptococcus orisratti TaxID=114652 RepID=UPI00146146CE